MQRHPIYDRVPSSMPAAAGRSEPQPQASRRSKPYDSQDEKPAMKPPRISKWQRLSVDTWTIEFVALAISVGSLCAIVAVLFHYNGALVPHLPRGITLNAIISTLGTASRSLLLYVTAASLGQLKWCWFNKTRRLRDMDTLDRASRGPMGSIWIVSRCYAMPWTAVGAIVMVTALAFDPFIQQVVRYPSRTISRLSDASTLPQAPSWYVKPLSNEDHQISASPMAGAKYGLPFLNAINTGIYASASQLQLQPRCAGPSCQWSSFPSVGWCSKCVDASSYATITDCDIPISEEVEEELAGKPEEATANWTRSTCSISFGHGRTLDNLLHYTMDLTQVSLAHESYLMTLTPTTAAVWPLNDPTNPLNSTSPIPNTFLGIEHPLLALAFAQWDAVMDNTTSAYTGLKVTRAEECVLSLCERNYSAIIANGSLNIDELSTNYGQVSLVQTSASLPPNETWRQDPPGKSICWQAHPGTLLPPYHVLSGSSWAPPAASPSRNDSLSWWAGTDTLWTNDTLGGICAADMYAPLIANTLAGNASSFVQLPDYNYTQGDGHLVAATFSTNAMARIVSSNLSTVLEGVATSLTRLNFETSTKTVTGNVTNVETYVHVSWEWLVLPAVLEALGLVVLLAAIFQSSVEKIKVWRTSILPLLFHGLEQPTGTLGESSHRLSSMRNVANHRLVRLEASEDDGRAVLASQMDGKS